MESKVAFLWFIPSTNLKISGGNGHVFPNLDFSLIVFPQVPYHGTSCVLVIFSFLLAYIKVRVHSLLHTLKVQ